MLDCVGRVAIELEFMKIIEILFQCIFCWLIWFSNVFLLISLVFEWIFYQSVWSIKLLTEDTLKAIAALSHTFRDQNVFLLKMSHTLSQAFAK